MMESVIISLVVWFIHVCTWEGMVLSVVARSLNRLPSVLRKPLYDCPTCMVAWWGPAIIGTGIVGGVFQVANIWQLLLIVASAGGINALLMPIIEFVSDGKKRCNCKSFKAAK